MLDISSIRNQFKALTSKDKTNLTYLDSAATTQKPDHVINTIQHYYQNQNANVHRGSHQLTAQATSSFESAREIVQQFVGARYSKEIIWTKGATESVNLIAQTYARNTLKPDDEILVSEMEHHANIVPWQIVAEQTGAKVVKIPMLSDCTLDMQAFKHLLSHKSKIVAVAHITNVTATRNPIEEIIALSNEVGAITVIDGAQGIVHEPLNLEELGADFYLFSGHKLYAPTGIGVLYGKLSILEQMPPWHGGGKMVEKVSFTKTTYSSLPGKFEAGTPNIAGAIALASAITWLKQFDLAQVEKHLHSLQHEAFRQLSAIEDINIIGYQPNGAIISFTIDGVHHQDIDTLLDQQGIAVRSGHHCAHPFMDALGIKGTVRVSFAIYNTLEDVDKLVKAVKKAVDML
ncbi:cysteine desulfurase [Vibrio sp. MACH09]|uniref:aminotransferase class V-fold PLP-dependent enzyme n=1 Tax=unclassified Vibrio TaxID=2614977 RepID=UPI001493B104|nr:MULTISPECIES: cysteine desulfurase [unclassified Vibrio]NOI64897.1 cysteine desulfurase [Vibrio sp. 99-8-1]GLO61673.1 cysteine desulfurase [Vibrio sp. MACH09]